MSAEGIYRRFYIRRLDEADYRTLSKPAPAALWLAVWLEICPESIAIPGVTRTGRSNAAEILGWSHDDFERCFRELEERGIAIADWDARVVLLPKTLSSATAESPNVVKAWRTAYLQLPECAVRREIDAHVRALLARLSASGESEGWLASWEGRPWEPRSKTRSKANVKTTGKTSRIQNQNQNQNQNSEEGSRSDSGDVWHRVLDVLRRSVARNTFNAFFHPTQLVTRDGDTLIVAVSGAIHVARLEEHRGEIDEAVERVAPGCSVRFEVAA